MSGLLTLVGAGWMLGFGGLGLAQTRIEPIYSGEKDSGITAFAVSDDGTVVVGTGGYLRTFRWTEFTDIQWISSTSYGDNSAKFYPQSMTADGASIYGTIQTDNGVPRSRLFIWKEGEGLQQIPVSAGSEQEGSVKAYAISRDGTCVVGEIQAPSSKAFLWTRAGGIRELGGGLPGRTSSRAIAVNENGSIIVGSGGSFPNQNAFFWTESSGMRDLQSYLEELGMDMDGWKLNEAVDTSPDGKVIVGHGDYQGQRSIFLITGLPPLTEADPESFPVATTAFSLLILGWMAWYLGFRRKA